MAIETLAASLVGALVTALVRQVSGSDDIEVADTIAKALGAAGNASAEDRLKRWFKSDGRETALVEIAVASLSAVIDSHSDFVRDTGGFDEAFVTNAEVARELSKVFTRDDAPDAGTIAVAWSVRLTTRLRQETAAKLVSAAAEPSQTFVSEWTNRVRKDPLFGETFDSVDGSRTAEATERLVAGAGLSTANRSGEHNYLLWVEQANSFLDNAGTSASPEEQISLSDVYVSLTAIDDALVSEEQRLEYDKRRQSLEEEFEKGILRGVDFESRVDALYADMRHGTAESEGQDVLDALSTSPTIAVLGDPGSGKTTLLRWLAKQHAQATRMRQDTISSNDSGSSLATSFPIYVRAGQLVTLPDWSGLSLSDFLVAVHARDSAPNPEALRDLFDGHLRAGDCVILFDGVDEIPSADDRRSVIDRFKTFADAWKGRGNRFIASSRTAGYRAAPLSGFVHFQIADLDINEDVPRFVLRYTTAMERVAKPGIKPEHTRVLAEQRVEAVLEAIDRTPGIAKLVVNPLMLTILLFVQRRDNTIPAQRAAAYHTAVAALEGGWRIAHSVPSEAIPTADARRYLPVLAEWVHRLRPAGIFNEADIVEAIGDAWASNKNLQAPADAPINDVTRDQISEFVQSVTEHCGLLVERAPQRWAFLHQSFQEFYVARRYLQQPSPASEMRKDLHNPRYEEPIRLALGIRSQVDAGSGHPNAEDLFEEAIFGAGELAEPPDSSPHTSELEALSDLSFAWAASTDEVSISPTRAAALAHHWLEANTTGTRGRFAPVGGAVRQTILELLSGLASNAENGTIQRRRAIEAFGHLGDSTASTLTALLDLATDPDNDPILRLRAAEALGQLGDTQGAAKVLSDLGSNSDSETILLLGVIFAFERLGDISANTLTVLLDLAINKDNDRLARRRAINAIAQLDDTEVAVRMLSDLAVNTDNDPFLRQIATASLRWIRDLPSFSVEKGMTS